MKPGGSVAGAKPLGYDRELILQMLSRRTTSTEGVTERSLRRLTGSWVGPLPLRGVEQSAVYQADTVLAAGVKLTASD